jgi:hypothetical protein
MPPREVDFFNVDENFQRGAAWYRLFFADAPDGAVLGEKTPGYLWNEHSYRGRRHEIPERMHRLLPDARLIVVLRDPVKRAVSALNHFVRARIFSPFVDPDDIFRAALTDGKDGLGLLGHGLYRQNLEPFLQLFPRNRLHVILFEDDVIGSPETMLDGVMAFLGKERVGPINRLRKENAGIHSRLGLIVNYYAPKLESAIAAIDRLLPEAPGMSLSAEMRARLYEFFAPHNQALFELVGRTTDQWNSR